MRENAKARFIAAFQNIKREGASDLLGYIEKSDFFIAPASTHHHGAYEGGLAEHSVNVYDQMTRLAAAYPEIKTDSETIAICSLLHDLCKIDTYQIEMRNKKINGEWVQVPFYTFNEKVPFGTHGGKSVFIAGQFIRLTLEEAIAINCHMGQTTQPRGVSESYSKYPLAWLLHVADEAATYLDESEEPK